MFKCPINMDVLVKGGNKTSTLGKFDALPVMLNIRKNPVREGLCSGLITPNAGIYCRNAFRAVERM